MFKLKKRNLRREFEENISEVLDSLYSIALYITQNREDAEDLVQEAALRAYRYFNRFIEGTNFKAWIVKIMRNIYINNYRRKKKEPKIVELSKVENFVSLSEIRGAEEEILQEKLKYAVEDLSEPLRIVLTLFYLEGFSYKEVAKIMDIPLGTVMSRLYTARQELKKKLFAYN